MGAPAVLSLWPWPPSPAPASGAPRPPAGLPEQLLLVSFDGFRWNYDQDVDTPNLDAMALDGVARYMTPAFITLTSPAFTLVTGECWPQMGLGVLAQGQPRNQGTHKQTLNAGIKIRPRHTVQGQW